LGILDPEGNAMSDPKVSLANRDATERRVGLEQVGEVVLLPGSRFEILTQSAHHVTTARKGLLYGLESDDKRSRLESPGVRDQLPDASVDLGVDAPVLFGRESAEAGAGWVASDDFNSRAFPVPPIW
jgi:hypothetical protein